MVKLETRRSPKVEREIVGREGRGVVCEKPMPSRL
jgi:hypothetical protein